MSYLREANGDDLVLVLQQVDQRGPARQLIVRIPREQNQILTLRVACDDLVTEKQVKVNIIILLLLINYTGKLNIIIILEMCYFLHVGTNPVHTVSGGQHSPWHCLCCQSSCRLFWIDWIEGGQGRCDGRMVK